MVLFYFRRHLSTVVELFKAKSITAATQCLSIISFKHCQFECNQSEDVSLQYGPKSEKFQTEQEHTLSSSLESLEVHHFYFNSCKQSSWRSRFRPPVEPSCQEPRTLTERKSQKQNNKYIRRKSAVLITALTRLACFHRNPDK